MGLDIISGQEALRLLAERLRLPQGGSQLATTEGVAAMLRYAGELECPCSALRLTRRVEGMVDGLLSGFGDLEDTLDRVISCGDLVAFGRNERAGFVGRDVIALGPPRFVPLGGAGHLLLGLEPEGQSLLPEAVWRHVELSQEYRRLPAAAVGNVEELLHGAGYLKVTPATYVKAPEIRLPEDVKRHYDNRLEKANGVDGLEEVQVIRPEASRTYYRGRWGSPSRLSCRTIIRRKRLYGADLWAYAELVGGRVERLLDLGSPGQRGCDEAWHLLQALDHVSGSPQLLRVAQDGRGGVFRVDVFSPLPQWATRFMAIMGQPSQGRDGAMFSWLVAGNAIPEVRAFLVQRCWLTDFK